MNAKEYLSRPYARRLTPDMSGGYVATIQEFPGLVAEGESANEALGNLEAAALDWIESELESGHTIPDPVELGGYSGKIALRVPRGLHKRAAEMACIEGTSLNQWLSTAIAHYLGSHDGMRAAINRMLISVDFTPKTANTYTANFFGPNFLVTGFNSVAGPIGSSMISSAPSYLTLPSGMIRKHNPSWVAEHDNG